MWSVNTSVARVVITWTVLGLFFIWIVFAGTSSYECPFQTPASAALRYLKDSATTRKFVATPPPPFKVISPPGRTPGRGSLRHPIAFAMLDETYSPGRFHCPAPFLRFTARPRRSDTEPSFYFSESIEHLGTQSRDWSKGSEDSGGRAAPDHC